LINFPIFSIIINTFFLEKRCIRLGENVRFETGIHLVIFLSVFIITGIVLSRKKKNISGNKEETSDIQEVQAEVFKAEEYLREAQAERLKAKLALEEAEKIKEEAKHKTEKYG